MIGRWSVIGLVVVSGFAMISCVAPVPGDGETDEEEAAPAAMKPGNVSEAKGPKGGGPANGARNDDAGGKKGKTVLCHIPPGNPANAHTIEVGTAAVPAHLAHGDHLGPCGEGGSGGSGAGDAGGIGGIGGIGGGGGSGPTCNAVASPCAADLECCSLSCMDGLCVAAGACLNDVDTDLGAQCSPERPCCDGFHCAEKFCFADEALACVPPGAPCDFYEDLCCWGYSCVQGSCKVPLDIQIDLDLHPQLHPAAPSEAFQGLSGASVQQE